MTRQSIHRTRGIVGLLAALTLGTLGARLAPPRTGDVDDVWAMEEAYWRYVKAGDVEKYRTLWNDGFRGWPCHTEHPATKSTITEWDQEIRDGKIAFDYKLTREGASNVGGPVTMVYANLDGGSADIGIVLLNHSGMSSTDFLYA